MPSKDELVRLAPDPREPVKLIDGTSIYVKELRLRQLFKLIKVITKGGYDFIGALDWAGSPDELVGKIIAVLIFSIPEAEDETIDLIVSLTELAKLEDEEEETYILRRNDWLKSMNNPEPEDAVIIIEEVIQHERDDLVSLGKRLQNAMKLASKTGQIEATTAKKTQTRKKTSRKSPASSETSAEPSTPSSASTAGTTTPL